MALRMSTLFLRTLREDPADAELPSHKVLVRARYMRRGAPGIQTGMPVAWKIARQMRAASPLRTARSMSLPQSG